MDQLPTELVSYLCSFLEGPSLCTFRLVCKAFASIAEEHLFANFEFRLLPNQHRLDQLEQLAASPSIASRLRCLTCESGVQLEYADYRYWAAQEYHERSSTWDRNLAAQGVSRVAYMEFHENLQARFTIDLPRRYDLYRWYLDRQAASMADAQARDSLVRILSELKESCPDLRLKMVMAEPQIRLEDLESFDPDKFLNKLPFDHDPRRRVESRRQHCLDHFVKFLEAAHLAGCRVTDLTAVDMPHELFATSSRTLAVLASTFAKLNRLELKISSFPHSDWLSRLGTSTAFATGGPVPARLIVQMFKDGSLQHLNLEFPVGMERHYSVELLDATGSINPALTWLPPLKSLSLCQFRCNWTEFERVLVEGRDLDTLVLKNCRLESGSMIDVLDCLAKRRLSTVSVLGTWYVDQDLGEWHSHSEDDFTTCFAATSYEGPYSKTGMRAQVDDFLHGRGECPLPRWTTKSDAHSMWEMMGDTSWHFLPGLPRL